MCKLHVRLLISHDVSVKAVFTPRQVISTTTSCYAPTLAQLSQSQALTEIETSDKKLNLITIRARQGHVTSHLLPEDVVKMKH